MDFGKKLMEKYGWREGEGLGKNNTGINKALKPNLKFDTAGLGCDQGAEINNHWWEKIFNEASNNIEVKNSGDDVFVKTKAENSFEITTKDYQIKDFKQTKDNNQPYKNFCTTSTIISSESETGHGNNEDNQARIYKPLTDEELFKACGGRTAHKGARHGLQLSGKLARIEEQEKLLLSKLHDNSEKIESNNWCLVKKKKKKTKKRTKEDFDEIEGQKLNEKKIINETIYNTVPIATEKKKKKRQIENDLSNRFQTFSMDTSNKNEKVTQISEHSKTIKKNKKKMKAEKIEDIDKWCGYREPINVTVNGNTNMHEDEEDEKKYSKKKFNTDQNNPSSSKSTHKLRKKMKSESNIYAKAKALKRNLQNITDGLGDTSMGIDDDN